MVWAAAKGYVTIPYWLLAAFALLGSSAVVFLDSAAIVTCMRNFPNERGNVGGMRLKLASVADGLSDLPELHAVSVLLCFCKFQCVNVFGQEL